MGWQMTTLVVKHSTHKGSELLALMMIADNADDDGRAFPSIETLARKCRLSKRSTQRILQALEASGELVIDRGGGRRTSTYWIRVSEQPLVTPNVTTDAIQSDNNESSLETRGDKLSPLTSMSPLGCQEQHPSDDTADTAGVTQLSHPESSRESSLESPDESSDNINYPEWFQIASAVPTWNMTYEKAEAWRAMAKVSIDLAERKAYGLASWMTPKRIKEGRKAYDS